MTNLLILLLAVATSCFGVVVVFRRKPPLWAAVPALLLYAFCGIHTVLLAWLTSDGIVVPGLQISPGLKAYYLAEVWLDRAWGLEPWLLALVVPAHLLACAPQVKPGRLKLPLPATVIFLGFLVYFSSPPRIVAERAPGPERTVYLTVAERGDGARMVLAHGPPEAPFLEVAHVHDTKSRPPRVQLHWTRDGKGIVLQMKSQRPFAIDLDGNVTGLLPVHAHEWPTRDGYESPAVKRRFSQARRDVAEFIQTHGGLYIR
ncbi:MAG: hypothetical protein ACYTG3_08850 [Planctomycetota bacterium]|jgi:hypothetical protein